MDRDYGRSRQYSAPGPYDSAAAGGDYQSRYPQEEYNSYQSRDQQEKNYSQGQQPGGAGGAGSTEYPVEVSAKVPPQYYGQTPQQHNRPPPSDYPAPAPGYAPSVAPPPFQQQAVTPRRPPPTGGPAMGPRRNQDTVRPDIGPPEPWASDLFGCFQDCYGCPLVILAPCITFGQIAEIVDTGYNGCQTAGLIYGLACVFIIPCLYSHTYRTKMRHRFNLREEPLDDCCTHFLCECCALAQEYRELRYRGIDPSLGYQMQQVVITKAMEAPVPPRMQASSEFAS